MDIALIPIRGGGSFVHSVSSSEQSWQDIHGVVTYEVAIIRPRNPDGTFEYRLAMRWHNSGPTGLGFPNTFGRPSWFEIDPKLEIATLNGLGLSAKQFADALNHLSKSI